jgi:uncharacterized protein (TIGR03437 family)
MRHNLLQAFLVPLLTILSIHAAEFQPTPGPAGPYHVSANRILDREGRPYLIRGTELAPVTLDALKPGDLGGLSASALVTIRQRLNMNAVQLPFAAAQFENDAAYRARVAEIVRTANRFDLLVILAPQPEDAPIEFWTCLAAAFRHNPNVFFAAGKPAVVVAIRAAGAPQPILIDAAAFPQDDANTIYRATASYAATRTDSDRWEQFGSLAERAPVMVEGLDPDLSEDSAECAAFPPDPADATRVVQAHLDYFDVHNISWIISAFRRGNLITDTRFFNGSKLDDGWTCGKPASSGLGMVLLAHLWQSDPHGLFVVNADTGSYLLARGGRVSAYGPILADRTMSLKPGQATPTVLGNVAVRVTDSRGVARLAPLLYAGGGWSVLNFVLPDSAAPGPAEIAIERTDGSRSIARGIIADVAPGLQSASADSRGGALGLVSQRLANGAVRTFEPYRCSGYDCRTVPIHLAHEVVTTLRLIGTGFRHARSIGDFTVVVGGVVVPVLSFGAMAGDYGADRITVRLPDELIGHGEMDLYMSVSGVLSDVLRIDCGGAH